VPPFKYVCALNIKNSTRYCNFHNLAYVYIQGRGIFILSACTLHLKLITYVTECVCVCVCVCSVYQIPVYL